MSNLDAEAIRSSLGGPALRRLERLEAFPTIESTNSYLMRVEAPGAGNFHVAVTDNQTAGRGRHGRTWQSPSGSGLCLSVAYTFATQPHNLPALTLAVGIGLIDALEKLGIFGVTLKWPNDLVAGDGKLGGILTESRVLADESIHVVTGVGLNVALPEDFDLGIHADRGLSVSDLAGIVPEPPPTSVIAARLVDGLCGVFVDYETHGFAYYAGSWSGRDWLRGRELMIDRRRHPVRGVAAGVAEDGALLVEIADGSVLRVNSGTVLLANLDEAKL